MGQLRLVAVSLLALTACGDDGGSTPQDGGGGSADARPIDAMPIDMPPEVQYDYSCATAPSTDIATTVTVTGVAQQLSGTTAGPASGVVISAYRIGSPDELVDTQPATDVNGVFTTAQIATNGAALNGYLKGTKTGYWPTYLYPAHPLAKSLTGVPIIMIDDANVDFAELLAQVDHLPGNGIVGVALTDCATPTPAQIPNATIEVYSGTTRVGDATIDIGAILGTVADVQGLYLVTNVPPGPVTVKATYYSHTFLENDVVSYADSLTTAQIKPGY